MKRKLVLFTGLMLPFAAFAQTALFQFNEYSKAPFYFIAVAIAAFAGTKAQSAAVSTALEGMARNPAAADKLFVPMLLGLALMESLVIFTLATVFLL